MARYTPRGLSARSSFRARSDKPSGKPKPRIGKAGLGKPGVGASPKFAKPSFKTPPKGAAKPAAKPLQPQVAAPDAAYNDAVDLAGRKGEQRLGELDAREANVKREFGIEDPTDPFSRANALKSAFLSRAKAASAGLASQGQLYSGAHERAISRTRREEEEARHNLRQAYEGAIGAIGAEKAGVKFATEEERAQAFEDWLARAPEADEPDPTEDEITAAEAAPAPAPVAPTGPVVVGSRPQETTTQSAEVAKQQARASRKAARLRAKVQARKEGKKAEGPGKPPVASINRPGQKARPKPKPKARKKGRR